MSCTSLGLPAAGLLDKVAITFPRGHQFKQLRLSIRVCSRRRPGDITVFVAVEALGSAVSYPFESLNLFATIGGVDSGVRYRNNYYLLITQWL